MSDYSGVLAHCLDEIENGQSTVEQCLIRYPQYPELERMLYTVSAVRSLPQAEMPSADRDAIRARALASLRATSVKPRAAMPRKAARLFYWWRLGLIVGAVLVVAMSSGIGLVK